MVYPYLQGLYDQPIFAGFHPSIVVSGYDQPVGTATTEMAQVVAETYPGHAFYGPCGLHHHRCFTLADVLQMAGQGTCFLEGQGFLQNAEIEVEIGEIRLVQFLDGRAKSNEAPVLKLSLRT